MNSRHSKSYKIIFNIGYERLKKFHTVNGEPLLSRHAGVKLEPNLRSRPEKNSSASTNLLVEIKISTFVGTCISKESIELRWPKKPLSSNQPIRNARNPLIRGNLCSLRKSDIGNSLIWIPSTLFVTKKLCWWMKIKENPCCWRMPFFRRSFNQAPLKCIAGDEVTRVLKEVHEETVVSIKRLQLHKQLTHLGYFKFTIKAYATSFSLDTEHDKSIVVKSTLLQLNYTTYLPPGHLTPKLSILLANRYTFPMLNMDPSRNRVLHHMVETVILKRATDLLCLASFAIMLFVLLYS